ncbi:MAG: hypothetical protein AAGE59_10790 [Cyanobacteria bacterium P01_F01_bin.86]
MPPSPDSDPASPTPPSSPGPQRSFPWFWFGTFLGTVFSAVGLGLAAWAWIFINEDLSPVISDVLTETLDRPVDLGEVEKVGLNSIRVGPSEVGASAEDPTTVSAESILVKFALIETLLTSELGLDLTLEDAKGYLEQDEEKGWLNVSIPEQEERQERRFEVRLDDIRIRNSQLTLVPLPPLESADSEERTEAIPIDIDKVNGSASFEDIEVAGEEARRTRFEVSGNPTLGGEIKLKGEVEPIEAVELDRADSEEKAEADSEKADPDKEDASVADEGDESALQLATRFAIQADKAPLTDILSFTLSTIGIPTNQVTITDGDVSGTMDMEIRPGNDIDYSGVITADNVDVETEILPLPFENASGQTHFQGNLWTVDQLKGRYGQIDAVAQGMIDFDNGYDLNATAKDVSVEEFTNTIDLKLPVPTEGDFDAVARMSGPIDQPEFSGTATAISPLIVDKVPFTSASTDFLLQGQQLYLDDIAATPSTGGSLRGSGEVRLSQGSPFTFDIAGRSLPAKQIAQLYDFTPGVKIGLVSADATVVGNADAVTTTVDWAAPNAQYPGTGTVDITNGTDLAFRDTVFQLAGGTVTGTGTLIDGLWDADVTLADVNLNDFSEDLIGDVSGQFQFNGTTADTRIGAIAGSGNVAFSNGLATFNREFATLNKPLTAQVAWNGEKVEILQSTTERITATGTITPIFDRGFDGLDRLDLNIVARDYDINEIPFVEIPEIFTLAGRADFTGTLAGKPEAPTIAGRVLANNVVVNNLPFSSPMSGTVDYSPANGLALAAAGGTDKILLNIGAFEDPATVARGAVPVLPDLNFDVAWRESFARGQSRGDLLNITAGNFPLSALNFPPGGAAELGTLRGTLTRGDAVVNLASQTLEGDIDIEQLGLGYIGAGQLAGQVSYANSRATLTNGELMLNGDLYNINGRVAIDGPVPVYSADIETQQGNVQGLLTALSIYQLEDFRRGLAPPDWISDPLSKSELDRLLTTSAAGDPNAALLDQLRRLSEIQDLQAELELAEANSPLPPLRELSGPFVGDIQLNGSGSDFQLDFDLAGANWQWGQDYRAEEVIAKGSVTPNFITLEPVRLASALEVSEREIEPATNNDLTPIPVETTAPEAVQPEVAFIDLSGQFVFGDDTEPPSALRVNAQNLEISALRDIFQLPIDIDGLANTRATIGGTLANPQLRGLTELESATINDTPIESANAQFLYQNARLSLTSALTATTPEQPLSLTAQIPYAFNFMEVQPDSDNISIDINVQDEGLALLNIFNQVVAWESGSGQFNLNVGGTLASPEISGFANLDEAVISAQILPEPLTNVSGRATFEGDRIIVETLRGSFSDGELTAAGTFPLLFPIRNSAQLTALAAPQVPTNASAVNQLTAEVIDSDVPSTEIANTEVANAEDTEPPVPQITEDPLFPQRLAADLPLTVNFRDVDLTLEDLYRGGVNGQIVVGGSALGVGPLIAGQVLLSQGQVLLPGGNGNSGSVDTSGGLSTGASGTGEGGIVPQFRDLRLTLGDSIRIVQGNLLNFLADGTLVLNGPPTDLEPDGTINLRSGRVSLYTQSFQLSGKNNIAAFSPETGLQNPFLNVSLRASVPEVNRNSPIASTAFSSSEEVDNSDTGFDNPGSLRTIRVRADVNGPANALFENLELTSSPPRSENELIALIGGGFVTALESTVGILSGSGNGLQELINIVSAPLLTSLQDVVGNTLSLSEFNLFPVTLSEDEDERGLDVAASLGFDLTNDTSLSVSKILTNSSNPEFGVNYRLTDALTVRGTTNLGGIDEGINQVLLEYELRF